MKIRPYHRVAGLLALTIASAGVQATPADIPTSLSGTYTLTYTTGTIPFASNSVHTFVINGSTDSLCVDGKLLEDAYLRTADGQEPLWADAQTSTFYGLSITNGAFNEINVYSGSDAGSSWVGQFTGSRTSVSTSCTGSGGLSISGEAESMFDLAMELYPDLFSNPSELREHEGYIYRFFEDSGIYVGIKDGMVSLLGGPFGNSIVSQGAISDVVLVLEGIKADLNLEASADMLRLFELAEAQFPDLFTGGSELRTSADGYLYRFYEDSGIYTAIRNGAVFLKGGIYGTFYTNIGTLNAILNQLEGISGGGGSYEIPEGEFTLTVTGTVSIFGISSGLNFVIEDVPAPDLNDQQAIEDAFEASLTDVEGLVINDFDYDVIDSSADHVEFTITVDATVQGTNFVYILNYDYVR